MLSGFYAYHPSYDSDVPEPVKTTKVIFKEEKKLLTNTLPDPKAKKKKYQASTMKDVTHYHYQEEEEEEGEEESELGDDDDDDDLDYEPKPKKSPRSKKKKKYKTKHTNYIEDDYPKMRYKIRHRPMMVRPNYGNVNKMHKTYGNKVKHDHMNTYNEQEQYGNYGNYEQVKQYHKRFKHRQKSSYNNEYHTGQRYHYRSKYNKNNFKRPTYYRLNRHRHYYHLMPYWRQMAYYLQTYTIMAQRLAIYYGHKYNYPINTLYVSYTIILTIFILLFDFQYLEFCLNRKFFKF